MIRILVKPMLTAARSELFLSAAQTGFFVAQYGTSGSERAASPWAMAPKADFNTHLPESAGTTQNSYPVKSQRVGTWRQHSLCFSILLLGIQVERRSCSNLPGFYCTVQKLLNMYCRSHACSGRHRFELNSRGSRVSVLTRRCQLYNAT